MVFDLHAIITGRLMDSVQNIESIDKGLLFSAHPYHTLPLRITEMRHLADII
jgi:hypothetical protein